MIKKIGIIVLLSVFNVCLSFAQTDINYQHKSLLKALKKVGVEDASLLKDVDLSNIDNQLEKPNGKFFLIDDQPNCPYQYVYVGRVNCCRAGGCSIDVELPQGGESEYFDYFVLFDKSKTVQLVKVFNYQATHGHEVTAKGWLKQFVGHQESETLKVDKNIDSISGATISVYAITQDVEMITKVLASI